jgi:hypothetical protein
LCSKKRKRERENRWEEEKRLEEKKRKEEKRRDEMRWEEMKRNEKRWEEKRWDEKRKKRKKKREGEKKRRREGEEKRRGVVWCVCVLLYTLCMSFLPFACSCTFYIASWPMSSFLRNCSAHRKESQKKTKTSHAIYFFAFIGSHAGYANTWEGRTYSHNLF